MGAAGELARAEVRPELREGVFQIFFRFGESNELHCFYLLYFYYMPFPAKVKRCAESLQSWTRRRGQARLSTTSQSHFVRQLP